MQKLKNGSDKFEVWEVSKIPNIKFEHFKKKVELDYYQLNKKIDDLKKLVEQQHLENIRSDELLLETLQILENTVQRINNE